MPLTKARGDMFFVHSPDLCRNGELHDFIVFKDSPYIRPLKEPLARHVFCQLASTGHCTPYPLMLPQAPIGKGIPSLKVGVPRLTGGLGGFRTMQADGVRHMHGTGCYHRDLKLENVVLTDGFEARIMVPCNTLCPFHCKARIMVPCNALCPFHYLATRALPFPLQGAV